MKNDVKDCEIFDLYFNECEKASLVKQKLESLKEKKDTLISYKKEIRRKILRVRLMMDEIIARSKNIGSDFLPFPIFNRSDFSSYLYYNNQFKEFENLLSENEVAINEIELQIVSSESKLDEHCRKVIRILNLNTRV